MAFGSVKPGPPLLRQRGSRYALTSHRPLLTGRADTRSKPCRLRGPLQPLFSSRHERSVAACGAGTYFTTLTSYVQASSLVPLLSVRAAVRECFAADSAPSPSAPPPPSWAHRRTQRIEHHARDHADVVRLVPPGAPLSAQIPTPVVNRPSYAPRALPTPLTENLPEHSQMFAIGRFTPVQVAASPAFASSRKNAVARSTRTRTGPLVP